MPRKDREETEEATPEQATKEEARAPEDNVKVVEVEVSLTLLNNKLNYLCEKIDLLETKLNKLA